MSFKTRKTLAKALAGVIEDPRLGIVSLIDNQNGPAGNSQFASVSLPDSLNIGRDEQRFTNDTVDNLDVVETSSGFRELHFSVQVFKSDAIDAAEKIRLSLSKNWSRQMMLAIGMGFSRVGILRDLTTTVDAGKEQRAQFDVYYNTIQSITDIVLAIESLDITGTYEGNFHDHNDVIELRKP